jgi:hypothetical protein
MREVCGAVKPGAGNCRRTLSAKNISAHMWMFQAEFFWRRRHSSFFPNEELKALLGLRAVFDGTDRLISEGGRHDDNGG